MSINRLGVVEKQVKKVKDIRYFDFNTSIFQKYVKDTPLLLEKAIESDKSNSRLVKIVPDEID